MIEPVRTFLTARYFQHLEHAPPDGSMLNRSIDPWLRLW